MKIVRFNGGLGNNLFQYAFSRSLAHLTQCKVLVDATAFGTTAVGATPTTTLPISHFNIELHTANSDQISNSRGGYRAFQSFYSRLNSFLPPRLRRIVREKDRRYSDSYFSSSQCAYFDGYWQSEKYFESIAPEIRRQYSLRTELSCFATSILNQIKRTKITVSLHIRRGDYRANSSNLTHHGVLPLDYYVRALTQIREYHNEFTVFVFSDDIPWARGNFRCENPIIFVERPPDDSQSDGVNDRSYEELILISSCTHHIIANSTFSWWGAWLDPNPRSIVIAPDRWFADNSHSSDIIPSRWQRI